MSILKKVWRFLNLSLSDPKAWNPSLWNLYGSQSESGETVTEETALTYSAVFNAIVLMSGTIGALPLHLMQKKGKTKNLADENSLYYVMHDNPNPFMNSITFRETMMAHILSWGNGYAEIVTNTLGNVAALWPIPPNRIIRIELIDGNLWYEVRVDGTDNAWLPKERMLHIPGLGFDGIIGYSPIAMARKSIGLGMAMETFGSRYFGHGTHPSAVVTHPNQIKDVKAVREALSSVYAGLGNTHRLMLLEEGMKIERLGLPPGDSQFLESRQFHITEIARWFNLPPHKLKDLTRAHHNNIEAEQINFVTDSILPWLIRIEQAYNTKLLTKAQRQKENLYFKHIIEGLLRADSKSRAEFYAKMFNIGAMSVNEIRAKEDLNPVEGGDIHLVPLNMTTLENAGKVQEPKQITEGNQDETTEPKPVQTTGNIVKIQNRK